MTPDSRYKCTSDFPCRRQENLGPRYCLNCEDLQLTKEEKAARAFLKRELEIYSAEDFPNGAFVKEWNGVDGGYVPEHQRGTGIVCSDGSPCCGIDKCTGWDDCFKMQAVA